MLLQDFFLRIQGTKSLLCWGLLHNLHILRRSTQAVLYVLHAISNGEQDYKERVTRALKPRRSDPREVEYGCLTPNYNKSICQVYIEAASAVFMSYRDEPMGRVIDPMVFAGIGWPRKVTNLPSWVTDWSSVPETREALLSGFSEHAGSFQTGGHLRNLKFAFTRNAAKRIRFHDAYHADTILAVTAVIHHGDLTYKDPTRAWFEEALDIISQPHSLPYERSFHKHRACTRKEALWRALVGDMYLATHSFITATPVARMGCGDAKQL